MCSPRNEDTTHDAGPRKFSTHCPMPKNSGFELGPISAVGPQPPRPQRNSSVAVLLTNNFHCFKWMWPPQLCRQEDAAETSWPSARQAPPPPPPAGTLPPFLLAYMESYLAGGQPSWTLASWPLGKRKIANAAHSCVQRKELNAMWIGATLHAFTSTST